MYILAALLIVIIWGFHSAIVKVGLEEVPVFYLLTLRFFFTGLVFLPFAKLKKKDILNLFSVSMFFNLGHLGFIFLGLQYLTAGSSASIQQLQVPMAVVLSAIILKEKIAPVQILGIIIAIIGVLIVKGMPEINTFGLVLTLLGALFFSINQIVLKRMGKIGLATYAAYTSLFSVPFLAVFAYLQGPVNWEAVNYDKLVSVLLFQVFIIGLSASVWQKIIEKEGVNKTTPFTLLSVVFAMIGGVVLLDEPITMHVVIGAAIIVSGVALTIFFKPQTKKEKLRQAVNSFVKFFKLRG